MHPVLKKISDIGIVPVVAGLAGDVFRSGVF